MFLNRHVAVAALVAFAGVLAGCTSTEVPPEPSLLWVGSDVGSITSGTDIAGTAVQGQAYIAWDQRLAERIEIVASTDSGDTVIFDSSTAAAGDCIADVMTITDDQGNPVFGYNADVDPTSCLEDGAILVQPTVSTTYTVQALAGQGRCDRSEFGVFLYPEECDFLTAPIDVLPPPEVNLSASASDPTVKTLTVTSGDDATVYYSVNLDTTSDWTFGVYDATADSFDPCVAEADADGTEACYYTEDANTDGVGTIVVPGVTAETVVSVEADNGADDGNGYLAPGVEEVTITVGT